MTAKTYCCRFKLGLAISGHNQSAWATSLNVSFRMYAVFCLNLLLKEKQNNTNMILTFFLCWSWLLKQSDPISCLLYTSCYPVLCGCSPVISASILSGEEGETLSLPWRPLWCHSFDQQARSDHTAALAELCSLLPQACVPVLQWHLVSACSGVASRTRLWHLGTMFSGERGSVGLRLGLDHFPTLTILWSASFVFE